MADVTTNKLISDLDFETIRANIAAFIANNTNFTDYNFEGSGLSYLMNILAYNTHYNAVYLNMAMNENFIDTAQLRSSVVSIAKQLGYTPKSKKSSIAKISFTITEPSDSEYYQTAGHTIYLDKTYKFASEKDGITYIFSPTETVSATSDSDGMYTFSDITVREGSYITIQYTVVGDDVNEKFLIDNFNLDLDSISVVVQHTENQTTTVSTYQKITDIKDLTPDSEIYYIFETTDKRYQISFGDGVLGKKLLAGDTVTITYQTSRGSESNNCKTFTFVSTIDSRFTNIDLNITNIIPSYGGSEEEAIDSIRYNAINNFRTQGRAVTAEDYKYFINRDYPLANAISVWGGQDEKPYPKYGKVFISFKPKNEFFLTNAQKELILETIIKDKNLVTVTPEIVDPTYTFIQINSIVKYNQNITNYRSSDISALVRNRIISYNDTELVRFGTKFNYSKFVTYLNETDRSITGNITRISLRKNINDITLNTNRKYSIDFQNAIHPGSVITKMPFKCASDSRYGFITLDLYLEDNENGILKIFRYAGTDLTTKIYLNETAGTVDYETGLVTLNNINFSSVNADGTLDIVCKPSDYSIGDIISERNNILNIIETDIVLDVRAE